MFNNKIHLHSCWVFHLPRFSYFPKYVHKLRNVHLYKVFSKDCFFKKFHTVDVQNPKQPPRMMIIPFIYRVEKPSKRWLALGFLDHQQYLPKICSKARLERGHKGIAFRTATGIGWILGFLEPTADGKWGGLAAC